MDVNEELQFLILKKIGGRGGVVRVNVNETRI